MPAPTRVPSHARTARTRALRTALLLAPVACGGGGDAPPSAPQTFGIEAPARVVVGDTIRATAGTIDRGGRPVPGPVPPTITFTGGAAVAAGTGSAIAVDTGTITIVATLGTARAERTVTVGMPATLQLDVEAVDTARVGDTTRVLAGTVRRDGAALAGVPVRWTVRDTALARVELRATGPVLVPVAAGTTELVARVGTTQVTRPLVVFAPRLLNFAIDVTTQVLDVGDTVPLSAGTLDAQGGLVRPDEVTFDVLTGGAVLQGTRTVRATAPGLVLVRARARGQEATDTLTVVPPSRLTVEVRIGRNEAGGTGVLSERARWALDLAIKRWRQVIREELPPQSVRTNTPGACRAPVLDETITGIVIFARELDLGTGIVAQAAACILRPDGRTLVGFIEMNSRFLTTLTDPQLIDTMVHELGHAFGFGSAWERPGGFSRFVSLAFPITWTGPAARANFALLRNTAAYTGALVPISTDRGHWNGTVFRGETMEPFVRPQNRLSAITVGALADMGYVVNDRSWERYALPGIAATPSVQPLSLHGDVIAPYGVVAPDGTVRPLAP